MSTVAASAWMIGVCGVTCLAVLWLGGPAVTPEAGYGMAAPLVSAVASWQVIARTQATAPARLTAVLVTAFAVKAVLFGGYVALVLGVLALRPVPFIASFTSYYVALHLGEALLLKRLLAAPGPLADAGRSQPHN
jgi:hypothetical protein